MPVALASSRPLYFEVNVLEILSQVVFVSEADPDNAWSSEFHAEFNELMANAVEHQTIVVIHDRIDEGAFVPNQTGSLLQREPVKLSVFHAE